MPSRGSLSSGFEQNALPREHQTVRGHILGQYHPRTNPRIRSDAYTRHNARVYTCLNIVTHHNSELPSFRASRTSSKSHLDVFLVKSDVSCYCAGAQVAPLSDYSIAHVGKMRYLCSSHDQAILDLT